MFDQMKKQYEVKREAEEHARKVMGLIGIVFLSLALCIALVAPFLYTFILNAR